MEPNLEIPDSCVTALSGHSVECMDAIWLLSGCPEGGQKQPSKLAPDEQDLLQTVTLV